ncbi:hypothetical protein GF361_01435 [Candidatus Woesearchaeota archaeon]|nr:hypothetical protein [Candidatus Woesearchaeota archaeon]
MAEDDKKEVEEELTEKGLKEKLAKVFPTFTKGGKGAWKGIKKGTKAVRHPVETGKKGLSATGRAATYDVKPGLKKGAKLAGKGLKLAGTGALSAGGAAFGTLKKGKRKTSSKPTGGAGMWFILAIVLYLLDLFLTRFNGIDVGLFLSRFVQLSPENMARLFLNGVVLVLAIAYLVLKKPNKKEFLSFFLLLEVGSLIITLGGVDSGSIIHLLFAISFYVFYLYPVSGDKTTANFIASILLFIDFFGFGILANYVNNPIISNRLIIPIWIYAIIITTKEKPTWMNVMTFFIIIINVFAFWNGAVQLGRIEAGLEPEQVEEAKGFIAGSLKNIGDTWGSLMDPVYCSRQENYDECLNQRNAERVCSEYEAETEEREECINKALGKGVEVEIKEEYTATNIRFEELTDAAWYSDIPSNSREGIPMNVILESPINNPVNIKLSCLFKTSDENKIPGIINPSRAREITVKGKDKDLVYCAPDLPYPEQRSVTAVFEVTAEDITTTAVLERIFVGENIWMDSREKQEVQQATDSSPRESKASITGDEFAVYTFRIGADKLIYDKATLTFTGKYEDLKKEKGGELLSIKKVLIDLREYGIIPSGNCEKEGYIITQDNNIIWEGTDKPPRLTCDLIVPEELKNIKDFEDYPIEFKSEMTYTYKYTKQKKIDLVSPGIA